MIPIQTIKQDLPHFPDAVIEDWIQVYANSEGWPPYLDGDGVPMGRWRYLLGMRPLSYWQSLTWSLEERSLDLEELSAGELDKISGLMRAIILKEPNMYADIGNSDERITRIVAHVRETGRLPKAPTLVQMDDGLSIVDGNHRMVTYFYLRGRAEANDSKSVPIDKIQRFWIGRSPAI